MTTTHQELLIAGCVDGTSRRKLWEAASMASDLDLDALAEELTRPSLLLRGKVIQQDVDDGSSQDAGGSATYEDDDVLPSDASLLHSDGGSSHEQAHETAAAPPEQEDVRAARFTHAVLSLWRNMRRAAAFRQWKEVVLAPPDLSRLGDNLNLNDDARSILYAAETAYLAQLEEHMSASTRSMAGLLPSPIRPSGAKTLSPMEMDLLVAWARQRHSKTFRNVSDSTVREVMRYVRLHQYEDGDVLFFEGEIGDMFYFLVQGSVAVYVGATAKRNKRSETDVDAAKRRPPLLRTGTAASRPTPPLRKRTSKPHSVETLGKQVFTYRTGDCFGETAMFTREGARTATAVAVGACEICELDKDVYTRTLLKYHLQFFEQAQKLNFVQRVPLFKDWQRHRLSSVADLLTMRRLQFGDQLLAEGVTVLTSCFFVLSGVVKITKQVEVGAVGSGNSDAKTGRNKPKQHRHGSQMKIELQTLLSGDIVALEALLEPNSKAVYTATAASANVELFELSDRDASAFLGGHNSVLHLQIRSLHEHDTKHRQMRLDATKRSLEEQDASKRHAQLSSDEDSPRHESSTDTHTRVQPAPGGGGGAMGMVVNGGGRPSSLIDTGGAPYLPHLNAARLFVSDAPPPNGHVSPRLSGRSDAPLGVVASPKMLSSCVKKFIFEHSDTLEHDYVDRLAVQFPPRQQQQQLNHNMPPTARRASIKEREEHAVLDLQMKQLYATKMQWDASSRGLVLRPPPISSRSTGKSISQSTGRHTVLRDQLQATQDSARKLVEHHLKRVGQQTATHSGGGDSTFRHFF